MGYRYDVVKRVESTGLVAVIRAKDSTQLVEAARALAAGGCDALEVTMTTPNALAVIQETAKALGDKVLVGVGSVLDPETARAAILAGAQFIVGPSLNPDVIRLAHRYDKPVMPGGFTPTEIVTAYELGADMVKVFPCSVGGVELIKALKGPLPQVPLVPTGGVDVDNVGEFIKAGASAVGVGGNLVTKKALADGDMAAITDLTRRYISNIKAARAK